MPILVKATFVRPLTTEEYDEAKQELATYIAAGHTKDYFPTTAGNNVSFREWSSREIAEEVVEKMLTKPWCKSAEIIET